MLGERCSRASVSRSNCGTFSMCCSLDPPLRIRSKLPAPSSSDGLLTNSYKSLLGFHMAPDNIACGVHDPVRFPTVYGVPPKRFLLCIPQIDSLTVLLPGHTIWNLRVFLHSPLLLIHFFFFLSFCHFLGPSHGIWRFPG